MSPSRIAGVVGSGLRSDTPLTKLRQITVRNIRSITAAKRLPKAIVSRWWCAAVCRMREWKASLGNIA